MNHPNIRARIGEHRNEPHPRAAAWANAVRRTSRLAATGLTENDGDLLRPDHFQQLGTICGTGDTRMSEANPWWTEGTGRKFATRRCATHHHAYLCRSAASAAALASFPSAWVLHVGRMTAPCPHAGMNSGPSARRSGWEELESCGAREAAALHAPFKLFRNCCAACARSTRCGGEPRDRWISSISESSCILSQVVRTSPWHEGSKG